MMDQRVVSSGIPALDEVLQGLRLGDNVVFQVDDLADYVFFAQPFLEQALHEGRVFVYVRFAPHAPILEPRPGLTIVELDPSPGFDVFSGQVHRVVEQYGREVFYLFDNLSALVAEWATDELLANFFQLTCPYLFELDTVTYFALTRGRHAHGAVARIRDTTQVLIDVFHADGHPYIHPLKVWDRYSSRMFLPHMAVGESWEPVFHSGVAASVAATGRKNPLRPVSHLIAPWVSVYQRLEQYRAAGYDGLEATPDIVALKQELSGMMLGHQPEFSRLADKYFTLDNLFSIRDRVIGSGRIGGKAAGMLVARAILEREKDEFDFASVMENHDSFYIGSDVFFTFLVNNDLFRLRLQRARDSQYSLEEFAAIEERFLQGRFPREIMEQFRDMLDYFGQAPIIIRSSSLLEDSFGNAFAGKYRSEFCANQGSLEQRLECFLRAVKLVYASALNPDALSYRRKRGLGDSDEQMAILVQRVSGMAYRHYFFPPLAGVAFSRNLYTWTDRIDPRQGIIRLVFGLGTRAVNRVGGDYPRMIAVSHPQLRPEVGVRIAKYSQREVDLLDLKTNEMTTLPLTRVLDNRDYANLYLYASIMSDGFLMDPFSERMEGLGSRLVLTFNNLIQRTDFVSIIGRMLAVLERAYGHPIDTEFTATVDAQDRVRINLLQCRPLWVPTGPDGAAAAGSIELPADIPRERVLFRATRTISAGVVRGIRHILYIDPRWYGAADLEAKKTLGRVVGRINNHPRIGEGKVLIMGPGRWGSSNIDLGVNVNYAEIDNTAVLVELAREEAGQIPEVSYGTHFFQDLVEAQIIYLPVFPGDAATQFNQAFFDTAVNVLPELLPDDARFGGLLHLIDVPASAGGLMAQVVVDPHSQRAVCYLE
ncbi:MAG: PEP/pyruvate-binding domain-containing protein [bacterium]|nr:PEP/pyruvate-binding domain-containing protein [bacterium]